MGQIKMLLQTNTAYVFKVKKESALVIKEQYIKSELPIMHFYNTSIDNVLVMIAIGGAKLYIYKNKAEKNKAIKEISTWRFT
jgi:hypothetical protein